jgi:hypothetical protein
MYLKFTKFSIFLIIVALFIFQDGTISNSFAGWFEPTGFGTTEWGYSPQDVANEVGNLRSTKVRSDINSSLINNWEEIKCYVLEKNDFYDFMEFYFYDDELYLVRTKISGGNNPETNNKIDDFLEAMNKKYGEPKRLERGTSFIVPGNYGYDPYTKSYSAIFTWEFRKLRIKLKKYRDLSYREIELDYWDPKTGSNIIKKSNKIYKDKRNQEKNNVRNTIK